MVYTFFTRLPLRPSHSSYGCLPFGWARFVACFVVKLCGLYFFYSPPTAPIPLISRPAGSQQEQGEISRLAIVLKMQGKNYPQIKCHFSTNLKYYKFPLKRYLRTNFYFSREKYSLVVVKKNNIIIATTIIISRLGPSTTFTADETTFITCPIAEAVSGPRVG